MDEGLGWMVEEMGREELLEEVVRLKNIVHELQVKEVDIILCWTSFLRSICYITGQAGRRGFGEVESMPGESSCT